MKILIRADASQLIGTGHIRRCLTLADQALKRGWTVYFAIRNPDEHIIGLIQKSRHNVRALLTEAATIGKKGGDVKHAHWLAVSQEVDAAETAKIVDKINADWIVVDHYALDINWHRAVKEHCQKVMVIDDLADRDLDCSLLLNQNLGSSERAYRDKVYGKCKYLMGPKYALLRQEFQEWRQASIDRRSSANIKEVLVTMGGVDASNYTLRVLQKIEDSDFAARCRFTVILGSAYPYKNELKKYINSSRLTIKARLDIHNMAETMTNADLCIGAAGSTSWERCCLGLPTLTLAIADNQQKISRALKRYGVAWSSSIETIHIEFDKLFAHDNSTIVKNVVHDAVSVCDGYGADRVLDHMEHVDENCCPKFRPQASN